MNTIFSSHTNNYYNNHNNHGHNFYHSNLKERVQNNDPTLGQLSIRYDTYSFHNSSSSSSSSTNNNRGSIISNDEIEAIVRALGKNTFVENFDLIIPSDTTNNSDHDNSNSNSNNYIGNFTAIFDAQHHRHQQHQLQQQQLLSTTSFPSKLKQQQQKQGPQHESTKLSYDFLRESLQTNNVLKKISISGSNNKNNADAWIALCNGIELNTSIEDVTFGDITFGNSIELKMDICLAIAQLLCNTTRITKFTFRGYILSTQCSKILANALQCNTSIQTLNLCQLEEKSYTTNDYNNNNSTSGLAILLNALANHKSITTLSIVDCDIDFDSNDDNDLDTSHSSNCSSSSSSSTCNNNSCSNNIEQTNNTGSMSSSSSSSPSSATVHPLDNLVRNNTKITVLKITDCILGPSEIPALCNGLQYNKNTKIKYLDLSGNDLLGDVGKPIGTMLQNNTSIKHLILEDNIIGDNGFLWICYGLRYNHTLYKLNIRSNHITYIGCEGLVDALGGSNNNNNDGLNTKCKLQALFLSENEIGDVGATYIGTMLEQNNTLESIELDACNISDKGVVGLASGLTYNDTLNELNISNNVVKVQGATSLSNMLSINTSLRSIHLSSCHIDNITIRALITSMKNGKNQTLKELWLSFNMLTNDGLMYLGEMIQADNTSKALTTLGIQFNSFDGMGLQYIVSALEKNYYMQDIYIWNGSSCTESGSILLQQMDYWLGLNQAGRRSIIECPNDPVLWPSILSRNDSSNGNLNALFYFLCEVPALSSSSS